MFIIVYNKIIIVFFFVRFFNLLENFDFEFYFEYRGCVKMKGKLELMECYFMIRKVVVMK